MRYELWQATRDLVEGRRRDTHGDTHGWISGSFHEDTNDGPRECLNGAIHLAEQQVLKREYVNYDSAQTRDATELKLVLASVICEQYPAELIENGYPVAYPEGGIWSGASRPVTEDEWAQSVIIYFNDAVASGENGQDAMNMVLDKTETRLFDIWWEDHEAEWDKLVEGADRLDELLPLV